MSITLFESTENETFRVTLKSFILKKKVMYKEKRRLKYENYK